MASSQSLRRSKRARDASLGGGPLKGRGRGWGSLGYEEGDFSRETRASKFLVPHPPAPAPLLPARHPLPSPAICSSRQRRDKHGSSLLPSLPSPLPKLSHPQEWNNDDTPLLEGPHVDLHLSLSPCLSCAELAVEVPFLRRVRGA